MRVVLTVLSVALASTACGPGSAEGGAAPITLSFRADQVQPGSEDYLCFDFDAAPLAGLAVERIAWAAPDGGGVSLHHATLYAMQSPFPDGPLSCLWMPADAVGLHIWAPGDDPLVMPDGFALSIPPKTTKMVVQAHVLRAGGAPAAEASVTLQAAARAPQHLAAWHSTIAEVPPIPPHSSATATSGCRARAPVHTLFAWPHMHGLGQTFRGAIQRAGGGDTPLVELARWDVTRERTYRAKLDIEAGDVIETSCTWENPTPEVVVGGLWTTDEMCTLGIILWPADAPSCERL
jgi:hypothetical protein